MITVVNKYKVSNHIYCGRGSPVGNPYPITKTADRNKVCDLYEQWFQKQLLLPNDTPFNKYIQMLKNSMVSGDINLGCFCAPKRCHCDTIKHHLDSGEKS